MLFGLHFWAAQVAVIEHRDEFFVDECLPLLAANDVTVLAHFRSLPDTKPFTFVDGISGGKKVSAC